MKTYDAPTLVVTSDGENLILSCGTQKVVLGEAMIAATLGWENVEPTPAHEAELEQLRTQLNQDAEHWEVLRRHAGLSLSQDGEPPAKLVIVGALGMGAKAQAVMNQTLTQVCQLLALPMPVEPTDVTVALQAMIADLLFQKHTASEAASKAKGETFHAIGSWLSSRLGDTTDLAALDSIHPDIRQALDQRLNQIISKRHPA